MGKIGRQFKKKEVSQGTANCSQLQRNPSVHTTFFEGNLYNSQNILRKNSNFFSYLLSNLQTLRHSKNYFQKGI